METIKELKLYVAINGNDKHLGTKEAPFATLKKACSVIREKNKEDYKSIQVILREGIHRLDQPITLTAKDAGSANLDITYCAYPGEKVTLSGTKQIHPQWENYQNGIFMCKLEPFDKIDQLFINGQRRILARYPNYDSHNPLMDGDGYINPIDGTDKRPSKQLIYDPLTFSNKEWQNPTTGILHVFQSHFWGNMQYRIKNVDRTNHTINLGYGGFQLQRRFGINHRSRFFVENIFEELDAPGEYFYDKTASVLYYMPFEYENLHEAIVEIATLDNLFELKGNIHNPVKYITIKGFTITGTCTTFMNPYEPLSRGDWSIFRGGAIYVEGAENCSVEDCYFNETGGNAIFISNYNRDIKITDNRFEKTGESAICFVGSKEAVRNYATFLVADNEIAIRDKSDIDTISGPKSPDYPAECLVYNNQISDIGIYGKQTAGVIISKSMDITLSHNTIYNVPRAAININDGTWGGHVIEYNDIWETVRETGEHGPFNAWGRDRQWNHGVSDGLDKDFALLDSPKTIVIRNNRVANFRKSISAGNWTIDLDDGSTNYHIYNNLNLGSTIKLRDGFYRKVENNICISSVALGFHVWPEDSGDTFERNIIVVAGIKQGDEEPCDHMLRPARMPSHPWGDRIDYNLYYNVNTNNFLVRSQIPTKDFDLKSWQEEGYDNHSVFADPLFMNPEKEDYRLKPDSPAFQLGFKPFNMNSFGHEQTKIVPHGGQFVGSTTITLKPHVRGGVVYYTVDGSDPTLDSMKYESPITITESTVIRAQTFDNNICIGFEEVAAFDAVDNLQYPSWLNTLIKGSARKTSDLFISNENPQESYDYLGATLQDITDGDLIDSLGGHDSGVVVSEVREDSRAYIIGFRSSDVITAIDDSPIKNLSDFIQYIEKSTDGLTGFDIMRGYEFLKVPLD